MKRPLAGKSKRSLLPTTVNQSAIAQSPTVKNDRLISATLPNLDLTSAQVLQAGNSD